MDGHDSPGNRRDRNSSRRRADATNYRQAQPPIDQAQAPRRSLTTEELGKLSEQHGAFASPEAMNNFFRNQAALPSQSSTPAPAVQTAPRAPVKKAVQQRNAQPLPPPAAPAAHRWTTAELNEAASKHGSYTYSGTTEEDKRAAINASMPGARGPNGQPVAATGRPAPLQTNTVGMFTYNFDVGGFPHEFNGTVAADGNVDGHAFNRTNGQRTEVNLLPPQVDKLSEFARADVMSLRARNPADLAVVNSGLPRDRLAKVANAEGRYWIGMEKTANGGAPVREIKTLLENNSDRVLGWAQSHPTEARKRLQDPNNLTAAREYMRDHAGNPTALSRYLGEKMGVTPAAAPGASTRAPATAASGRAPAPAR